MDKNAPSDFTLDLHSTIAIGLKNKVPLEFMVMNLEITKIDLANRFINQQAAFKAHGLAQNIADESFQLSKKQQEEIKARNLAQKIAEATPQVVTPNGIADETGKLNKLNN